jgi:hypothetical protein
LIDKTRTLLKPECFVPQVSVEQPRHRLTDVTKAKDENISRFFASSPKHSDEQVVVALRCRLDYRRTLFVNFIPEFIQGGPIT